MNIWNSAVKNRNWMIWNQHHQVEHMYTHRNGIHASIDPMESFCPLALGGHQLQLLRGRPTTRCFASRIHNLNPYTAAWFECSGLIDAVGQQDYSMSLVGDPYAGDHPKSLCMYVYIHISNFHLIACNDTQQKAWAWTNPVWVESPGGEPVSKSSTGYITMDAADNIKEVKAQF